MKHPPMKVKDYHPIPHLTLDDLKSGELRKLKQFAVDADDYGRLRATKMVGITQLETVNGDNVILQIEPRFPAIDPFRLLEELTRDEDFLEYAEHGSEPLYHIFDDEPFVEAPGGGGGEALTALSFVMRLYQLCRRQLKPQMTQWEQNLNGRVKGKIAFKSHLQNNVLRGREHQVYCRYNLHTTDNIENRILKAALHKAKGILDRFYRHDRRGNGELASRIAYCQYALRDVSETAVSLRDFAAVRTTGYYAYYKPVISMAKLLFQNTYAGVSEEESGARVGVLPFSINMQKLFEVYVYSKLKEISRHGVGDPDIDGEYKIELLNRFGQGYPLTQSGCRHPGDKPFIEIQGGRGLHLQGNVCPDFYVKITRKSTKTEKTIVLDAKYKHAEKQDRSDTLQIFAYAYIFQADALGFVFPMEEESQDHIAGTICGRDARYLELFMKISANEDAASGNRDVRSLVKYLIGKIFP